MTEPRGFWLRRWMTEFEIGSVSEYNKALRSPTAMKALYELAVNASWDREAGAINEPGAVLAGHQLDLSGSLSCSCSYCQRRQLGRAIARTSHYFDKIIVSGPRAEQFTAMAAAKPKEVREQAFRKLASYVDFHAYIEPFPTS